MTRFSYRDYAITYLAKEPGRSGEAIWGVGYVPAASIALREALVALSGVKGCILEVGCGAGRYVRTIKRLRPDLAANGCDSSAEAVDCAKEYGDEVDFAVGDAENLLYGSAEFDAVVFFDLLEHLSDPRQAIAGIHRVLRPGGILHCLVPCEGQRATLHWAMWRLGVLSDLKERHAGHVQRFTHAEVRQLLTQEGFQISTIRYGMHLFGQLRDVLGYLPEEGWAASLLPAQWVLRFMVLALWPFSRVEFLLLHGVAASALNMHITAVCPA
jgi:SAM-dependent methyltransferase